MATMAVAPMHLSQNKRHLFNSSSIFTKFCATTQSPVQRRTLLRFIDVGFIHRGTKSSSSTTIVMAATRRGTQYRTRTRPGTGNGAEIRTRKEPETPPKSGAENKSRNRRRSKRRRRWRRKINAGLLLKETRRKSVEQGIERYKVHGQSQPHKKFSVLYSNINYVCGRGMLKPSLSILNVMGCEGGIPVDSNIYDFLLQACINMKALEEGKQVHAHMRLTGQDRSAYLGTKLVNLYTICGSLVDARLAFERTSERNMFLWNALIRGYTRCGFHEEEALKLYHQMKLSGIQPDNFTFSCALKACAGLSDLQQGKEIHNLIIKSGYEADVVVGSALVGMYAKCGGTEAARQVFDKMSERDVVSWSAVITAFNHSGLWKEALEYFRQMQIEGVKPNSVTMASVLPACGNLAALQEGREIHGYIIRSGFDSYSFVGSSLIDMYFKCSTLEIARQVFDKMSERDVISWSTMVVAYTKSGCANEALEIFSQMKLDGMKPNQFTIENVLPACGHLAALQQGKEIHAYTIRSGFEANVFVCCGLMDMYAKCGSIEPARHVFDKIPEKGVVSWTVMIAGYGINGHGKEALTLFHQMQKANVKPNHITFVAVLFACSNAGLVAEGWEYFNSMSQHYHITPRVEHYACMVDLLGHAGYLNEAQSFIQDMPLEPDATVWQALLGACRIHGNTEIGEHAAERLLELEPRNAGNSILLANFYAATGRWDDVAKVRTMMKNRKREISLRCS